MVISFQTFSLLLVSFFSVAVIIITQLDAGWNRLAAHAHQRSLRDVPDSSQKSPKDSSRNLTPQGPGLPRVINQGVCPKP